MSLSREINGDLSDSYDSASSYSTSPWESPKSTTSTDNHGPTHSECSAEEFTGNSSSENNTIHDSEDKPTLESDKEDVNYSNKSKLRHSDSVTDNSVNLNSKKINVVTDHELKTTGSILNHSDHLDSVQTIGIEIQEPADVILDLPHERLDSNEKNAKLSNLMLEYPDHVDTYDLLTLLDQPSYSPESEGFPDNPEWDDVEGYTVNIEESIIETTEIQQEILIGKNKRKIKESSHKKLKLSSESETSMKKSIFPNKYKKNKNSSRKMKKISSAFQI